MSMSWKVGYVIATIITAVSFHPIAIFIAKSAQPTSSTALSLRQKPDSKQAPQNPQDKIVLNTKLVNMTVSVNDKLGRFVAGLTKEDFEIFDDKIKQDIVFFSDDDAPISLGLVYDVSGSMGNFSTDRGAGVVSIRLCLGRGCLYATGVDAPAAICHRLLPQ